MSTTIYIIRHGEKPPEDGVSPPFAFNESGTPDKHSLTAQGWQRAGAWAAFFAPAPGPAATFAFPAHVYASARARPADAAVGSKSNRPVETVTPLTRKLGMTDPDDTFTKGQEVAVATAAAANAAQTVLICWQHEAIADIVNALIPGTFPANWQWPGARFNPVFILRRPDSAQVWHFAQASPKLLPLDPSTPLSLAVPAAAVTDGEG